MKFIKFAVRLLKEINDKQLLSIAAELTYKLLLSVFPFLIFLFSIIGFLNLNSQEILDWAFLALPDQIVALLSDFVKEVVDVRSVGLLSTSLLMSIYSSSSGFKAAIHGINKAHGRKDSRGFIKIQIICVSLVFLLVGAILFSLLVLIFSDIIYKFVEPLVAMSTLFMYMFGIFKYLLAMVLITLCVLLIYYIAAERSIGWKKLLPGAFCTSVVWVISSKLFNVYINNFSRYSKVYGSIAGIFILIFWLNIISTVILAGAEINALVFDDEIK